VHLTDVASRLRAAGDEFTSASAALGDADPGARAFGADGPGRLGELGRTLHGRLAAALAARGREATALGARLGDAAHAVQLAVIGYRDTEQTAQHRHERGEP
jgi:hypothetical protein